jgi:hypothetical protein
VQWRTRLPIGRPILNILSSPYIFNAAFRKFSALPMVLLAMPTKVRIAPADCWLATRRVDPSERLIELLRAQHCNWSASVYQLGIQGVLSRRRVSCHVLHDGASMTENFFH